jgi:hypothetical protein
MARRERRAPMDRPASTTGPTVAGDQRPHASVRRYGANPPAYLLQLFVLLDLGSGTARHESNLLLSFLIWDHLLLQMNQIFMYFPLSRDLTSTACNVFVPMS